MLRSVTDKTEGRFYTVSLRNGGEFLGHPLTRIALKSFYTLHHSFCLKREIGLSSKVTRALCTHLKENLKKGPIFYLTFCIFEGVWWYLPRGCAVDGRNSYTKVQKQYGRLQTFKGSLLRKFLKTFLKSFRF